MVSATCFQKARSHSFKLPKGYGSSVLHQHLPGGRMKDWKPGFCTVRDGNQITFRELHPGKGYIATEWAKCDGVRLPTYFVKANGSTIFPPHDHFFDELDDDVAIAARYRLLGDIIVPWDYGPEMILMEFNQAQSWVEIITRRQLEALGFGRNSAVRFWKLFDDGNGDPDDDHCSGHTDNCSNVHDDHCSEH